MKNKINKILKRGFIGVEFVIVAAIMLSAGIVSMTSSTSLLEDFVGRFTNNRNVPQEISPTGVVISSGKNVLSLDAGATASLT